LRNFTTGATVSISGSYSHALNSQNDNYELETPLHVSKDDELEIIWSTPQFDIEPTLVSHSAIVYIVY
jgi:hypothetical protein